jgi:predicted signal transduction protein with EAL and GGDEF domain
MGVVVSQGFGEDEVEAMLSRADPGLYRAKENGRNGVKHAESAAKEKQAALPRRDCNRGWTTASSHSSDLITT